MGAALNLILGCAFKMILVECCLVHEQALCHGLHNERSGVAELLSTCLKPKTGVPMIVPAGRQNLNRFTEQLRRQLGMFVAQK
jgi:hypothetical protein